MTIYIKHHTPVNWSVTTQLEELSSFAKSNDILASINNTLATLSGTYNTIKLEIVRLEKYAKAVANGINADVEIKSMQNRRGILRIMPYIDSYNSAINRHSVQFVESLIKHRVGIIDRIADTVRFKKDFLANNVNGTYNIYMRLAYSGRAGETLVCHANIFDGTVCPKCDAIIKDSSLQTHMATLKCLSDTASVDVVRNGYTKVYGPNVIKAVREAGIDIQARPIEYANFVPEWVSRAVIYYESNRNTLAGLTLTEFLSKSKPDDFEELMDEDSK